MTISTNSRQGLSRRGLMAGAAGLATAYVSRNGAALAQSSGEVRVLAWAGYLNDDLLAAFNKKTGIKAVYTPFGTNDELLNQMRATTGQGFDVIWPSVDRVPNYVELDLLQPIDEKKINVSSIIESAYKGSEGMGGVVKGTRFHVPTDWGTEAVAFDKKAKPLTYGKASFGDIWAPEMKGKSTVRGHSGLVGLGLWLEGEGKLPAPMRDAFKDEATMVKVYDVIIKEAIARKGNVVQFWTNENTAQGAFRANGAVIGQTWDSTAVALIKEKLDIGYVAPKEGALAWMEGVSIPKGAKNLDQAYAFINWMVSAEAGAMYANLTGINTTAKGADALLSETNKAFFAAAYPGDALQKLWWWPIQDNWFVAKRNEYQDRFLSA